MLAGDPSFNPLQGHRILIAFNPVAGSGGRQAQVTQLVESLRGFGFDARVCHGMEVLVEGCRQYLESGELRGVVAAGGDGTFSLVANRVPPQTPIAAFPLGTENLLAQYLSHSSDPSSLGSLFSHGVALPLDAGEVNGRLFALMAGCGFDADVVERLHRERRGPIYHWSYVKPILDSIRTYAYPRLQVQLVEPDGQSREIECRWAFVVNVPRYACGLDICPDALANDGLLNVVTFKEGSLLAGLRYLSGILAGSHLQWDDVTCSRANRVRIEAEYPTPYQLDGDPGGMLPVEFRCVPERLRVIVSPQWLTERTTTAAVSA